MAAGAASVGVCSFTIDASKNCYLHAYRTVDQRCIGVYVALYGNPLGPISNS